MKIIGINGSPRKDGNTGTLLKKALQGAASVGAQTELVHLYDHHYKGCISCFACKELGGKSYGRCVVKDPLTPIYQRIEQADAFILGSPVYLGSVSGQMQSFLERLVFPYLTYTDPPGSLFPRKISTAFILTMGLPEEPAKQYGYPERFANVERFLKLIFGSAELLWCFDTYQFEDYSKYYAPRFDAKQKFERRRDVFPKDCEKAFALGRRLMKPYPAANDLKKT